MQNKRFSLRPILSTLIGAGIIIFIVYKLLFYSPYPQAYRLGMFDKRFGLSQERFLQLIDTAKSFWERQVNMDLFTYDASASFPVNLIFDERQQHTHESKRLKAQIAEGGKSYEMLEKEYTAAFTSQQQLRQEYEESARLFEQQMNERNAKVNAWNQRGGASEQELQDLRREDQSLDWMREQLDKKKFYFDETMHRLDALATEINSLADKYNLTVNMYNGKFIQAREFEQGSFDGSEINIYQFEDEASLTMALVHEFGHALGLEHSKSPESIMYYKLERQDVNNIRLADDDIAVIRKKFNFD